MLYIDGQWIEVGSRDTLPVISPATGREIGRLPMATGDDLDRALSAASRAFAAWKRESVFRRAALLKAAASGIRAVAERVARLLTLEQGKPLVEARAELEECAQTFEWYAEQCTRPRGYVVPGHRADTTHTVVTEPIGVVVALSPWNFPPAQAALKLAPALAAGCTCIIKPPEETPYACIALVRALAEAGFPDGCINLVFGDPPMISERLIASPLTSIVSFTGSVAVGKTLAGLAAQGPKPCVLELGGNAPAIVCADADPVDAARALGVRRLRNAGQVCTSPNRFFVHDRIHEAFTDALCNVVAAAVVGDGRREETTVGPLANERRLIAMEEFVADARDRGGRVMMGGERIGSHGFFWAPTVVANADDAFSAMRCETFGPVMPIARFQAIDEVIERANAVPAGLASYAFTRSQCTAKRLAEDLDFGVVAINSGITTLIEAPFGGFNASGYGKESGAEGFAMFRRQKLVHETAAS